MMKHLFVFVDFSQTAILAFNQALAIAQMKESKITICHIVDQLNNEIQLATEEKLRYFIETADKKGIKIDPLIVEGELFETAKNIVNRLKPDLIVLGTHGIEGIHLRLFGSAIHKLVREVPAPSLVLGKTCSIMHNGFNKVLIPAGSQPAYLIQVERASELLAPDGEITLFAIENAEVPADNSSMINMDNARKLLDARNIKWKYVEIEAKPHQTGVAAQTLEYILAEGIQMIAITAEIAERFKHFGKLDKEAILLNEHGIKVLCVNKLLV